MLTAVGSLQGAARFRRRPAETAVFVLHYRLTALMLAACCAVVTTRQLVGERIRCAAAEGQLRLELLEDYCWAADTYSVSASSLRQNGAGGIPTEANVPQDDKEYVYQSYYQYVYLVLFLQSLLFYTPHIFWKILDRNRLEGLYKVIDLYKATNTKEFSEAVALQKAAAYIHARLGTQNDYAIRYVLCEILTLVNLIFQSFLLDIFLQRHFFGLGLYYLGFYRNDVARNPSSVFPLITHCYFKRFGPGGFVDVTEALCVLSMNVLNLKIFLFVWVWFALLFVLTVSNIASLIMSCAIPKYRTVFMRIKGMVFHRRVDVKNYIRLMHICDFGDWFVLSCIRNNMDALDFSTLIDSVWSKVKKPLTVSSSKSELEDA